MIKRIFKLSVYACALTFLSCSNILKESNQEEEVKVKIATQRVKTDQIGYYTNSTKIAILPDSTNDIFQVVNILDSSVVFQDSLSHAQSWSKSGTRVRIADFSKLNTQGIYQIKCEGAIDSYPFAIGENIYSDLARIAMKSFYYARVGVAIDSVHGGQYARPAAHMDKKVIIHPSAANKKRKAGQTISSPGGWYDAGDYGKYVVNSNITVSTMLMIAEMYPEYIKKMELNIPESGNDMPDMLDEILVNLRWMITMQDPTDGGVYHKLTSKSFCGFIMPQDDKDDRYVIGKTTTATLGLAATCAKAYRIFKNYDKKLPKFCDTLLNVAQNAWKWAEKNPNVLYKQPEDIHTGTYNDDKIRDEWTWAALEMYLATGRKNYMKSVKLSEFEFKVQGWDTTSIMGVYSMINNVNVESPLDDISKEYLMTNFIREANSLVDNYKNCAYRVPLDVFPWGSNSQCANEGIWLLMAYKTTKDAKYLEAAQACMNYILGRNPMDYCYVTGMGSNPVKNVHDRRSFADGIENPVPGYLCGGPNATAKGDVPDSLYISTYPAMRYVDHMGSFTTNEIAINWNAALVTLAIGLDNELK